MTVIAISESSYLPPRDLAAGLARRLCYNQAGPELLDQIAQQCGDSRSKLEAALGAFKGWSRLSMANRQRLLAETKAQLLTLMEQDSLVTHGLAAHLFVRGVSHVFKVRLIADQEERLRRLAEAQGLSNDKALKRLEAEDQDRRQWSQTIFGEDEAAANLYDLVINLDRVEPEQALPMIAEAATARRFQPMTFSLDLLRDQALASRVRAQLVTVDPRVRVDSGKGRVWVQTTASKRQEAKKAQTLRELALAVAGVRDLEVQVLPDLVAQAADGMR
jgi:cytidylate kinase